MRSMSVVGILWLTAHLLRAASPPKESISSLMIWAAATGTRSSLISRWMAFGAMILMPGGSTPRRSISRRASSIDSRRMIRAVPSTPSRLSLNQGKKLQALRLVGAESSPHRRGDDGGPGLLHAAHGHTGVLRLDNDSHCPGRKPLHDGIRDLGSESLLELRATGEKLNHPRQLADPHYLSPRDIGDVRPA